MPGIDSHLGDVTVLDLASVGPAARASRILADYGADVVKVAPTSRKGAVQINPAFYAYGASRGMRRIRVDLKAVEGLAAFRRLAAHADVVIESFRPGVAARIGVGYDDLRVVNPGIVYCSTSGYGQEGPYSTWAGHDLNYLAMGGFLHCSGRAEDGRPTIPGATVADSAAGGMQAVIAILAALHRRAATGQGQYLDVSVADGVVQLMSLHVDRFLATGEETGPRTDLLTGRYAFYEVYRTRDDKWLAVGAIEPAFYANLCKALGLEQWLEHQMDDAVQDDIRNDFATALATKDRDEWVALLAPANTCVSPVYSIAEVAADPGLNERGVFCDAIHPEHGNFRQVGAVLAGGNREQPVHRVGEGALDTDALLASAGLSAEEISGLHEAGAVE